MFESNLEFRTAKALQRGMVRQG